MKPRPRKVKDADAEMVVSRSVTRKKGAEVLEESAGEIRDPVPLGEIQNPAYVGVQLRATRNQGNYNSVQIGITVTMPCRPSPKGMRKGKDRAASYAQLFLEEELANALGEETD